MTKYSSMSTIGADIDSYESGDEIGILKDNIANLKKVTRFELYKSKHIINIKRRLESENLDIGNIVIL